MMSTYTEHRYTELIGNTFVSVEQTDTDELVFIGKDRYKYKFYHRQSCCEKVEIIDIIGDLADLVGSPIFMAEEVTYKDADPDNTNMPFRGNKERSFTWTFYKFATAKGYVTVRWYGESRGYYSERVDFTEF